MFIDFREADTNEQKIELLTNLINNYDEQL